MVYMKTMDGHTATVLPNSNISDPKFRHQTKTLHTVRLLNTVLKKCQD